MVTIPPLDRFSFSRQSWSNARPRSTRSTRRCAAEQRVSARSKAVEDHQKHFGYPRRAISNETRPLLVSKDTVESPPTVGSLLPRVHMTVTLPKDIKPERKRGTPSRHVCRASFSVAPMVHEMPRDTWATGFTCAWRAMSEKKARPPINQSSLRCIGPMRTTFSDAVFLFVAQLTNQRPPRDARKHAEP